MSADRVDATVIWRTFRPVVSTGTSSPWAWPITIRVPPLRTISTPSPKAAGGPAHSITRSAPRPEVSSRTASTRSAGLVFSMSMRALRPHDSAAASRLAGAPIRMVWWAPEAAAAAAAYSPTGPAPSTTAVWPKRMGGSRSRACITVRSAQVDDEASAGLTPPGTRSTRLSAATCR